MSDTTALTATTPATPVAVAAVNNGAQPAQATAPGPRTLFEAITALSTTEASIAAAVSSTGSIQTMLSALTNGPVAKGSPVDVLAKAITAVAQRPVEVSIPGRVETIVEYRVVLAETRTFSLLPIWALLDLLHRVETMLERALKEPKQAREHLTPHPEAVHAIESAVAGHGQLKSFRTQAKALHVKLAGGEEEVERLLTLRLTEVRAFTASVLAHAARAQNASHG
jgi:hypothetical protein